MNKCLLLLLVLPAFTMAQKQKDPTGKEVAAAYQSLPKIDGQYEWAEVVALDSSLSKDILYKRAKLFFTNEFKNASKVVQYDDAGEGKIIGKGNFSQADYQSIFTTIVSEERTVSFTLEIYCKDGRYRYRIYDVLISGYRGQENFPLGLTGIESAYKYCDLGATKKMERRLFVQMIDRIRSFADEIKKTMSQKAKDDF